MPGSRPEPEGQDDSGSTTRLTVAAVARRLGVAPATLRTWARRYGLGPSDHTAGAHRRYSTRDLGRLVVMRRLTQGGVPPVQAARLALDSPVQDQGSGVLAVVMAATTDDARTDDAAHGRSAAAAEQVDGRPPGRASAGGGNVLAMPAAGPAERGLARAALALDGPACTRLVIEAIRAVGVASAYESLALPVLEAVGRRWELTGAGIDVEHLLSESVLAALRAQTGSTLLTGSTPTAGAVVLLACAEEDQHSLPLHVLAATLAERRVGTRVLGARVPREALAAAVRRCGPAVVFLYAAMPVRDAGQLEAVPRLRPPAKLVVGGPGWGGVPLPDGLPVRPVHVGTLGQAVHELVLAAG